jgi:L-threonylcarbamoyladenylate synthase
VRWPAHPVAAALIQEAGVPIAAPSANRFGRTSPTSAQHVLADLDGRIDAIVDAGESVHGLESTVLDICEDPPLIYRPGVVTLEQIQAVCPNARMYVPIDLPTTDPNSLPAPGVGIRHYAPRARLELVDADPNQVERFHEAIARASQAGERVGLMLPDSFASRAAAGASLVFRWGKWNDEEELAQRLFAGLRQLDAAGATVIFCPVPPGQGIGVAIRDRLRKASRQA